MQNDKNHFCYSGLSHTGNEIENYLSDGILCCKNTVKISETHFCYSFLLLGNNIFVTPFCSSVLFLVLLLGFVPPFCPSLFLRRFCSSVFVPPVCSSVLFLRTPQLLPTYSRATVQLLPGYS